MPPEVAKLIPPAPLLPLPPTLAAVHFLLPAPQWLGSGVATLPPVAVAAAVVD